MLTEKRAGCRILSTFGTFGGLLWCSHNIWAFRLNTALIDWTKLSRARGRKLNTVRGVSQHQTTNSTWAGHNGTRNAIGTALLERLRVLAIAVAAIGVAAPAIAGDFTITPSLEFREAFSDNVDLDPDGEEKSALISEIVPGVTIRSESARATVTYDAFPVLRHQNPV